MKERASLIKWGWQFVHPFWVQTFEKTLVLMANHHDKYDSLAKGILCLDDKKGVANAAYS